MKIQCHPGQDIQRRYRGIQFKGRNYTGQPWAWLMRYIERNELNTRKSGEIQVDLRELEETQ
jgi:hypothetical protein